MGQMVRVLLWCLLVGLALSFFDIHPVGILTHTWTTVQSVAVLARTLVEWALPYVLLGAVVVVPLVVAAAILRLLRNRGG